MSPALAAFLLTAPIAVPALSAAATFAAGWRAATAWTALVTPVCHLAAATVLGIQVTRHGPVDAAGGVLRADALTVWVLAVIGAVGLIACWSGPAYLAAELGTGHTTPATARRYGTLVQGFLAAMAAAVLAGNLGVLWVAIEATTVITAFLVGHAHTRGSVEAAWKYVVICSVGIALAFLGTVLLHYAARSAGIDESHSLDWATLAAHNHRLDPAVTKLATVLVVIGYGAKAGLVPLHAWLPDAHGQAPAPVSALMSGVLLAVSFTALLRFKVIADVDVGPGFTRTLLIGIALLTLAVAAILLAGQRDYKRMLAYSSMEHLALIALGAAAGTALAMAAVLLHIAGHGLAKAVAFCSAGHLSQLLRSTKIADAAGIWTRAPAIGVPLGLAGLALLGFPPFAPFASELGIVRSGFGAGLGWAVAVALSLLTLAFAAMIARGIGMLAGPEPGGDSVASPSWSSTAPLAVGLTACAVLGVTLGPLRPLLDAAAAITAH